MASIKPLILLLVVSCGFACLAVHASEVYRWVDEDGVVHFSQTAPLQTEAEVDKLVRFVRASMKGWKWAEGNAEAAANIVLEYDETGAQTEKHQVRMMGEIAKLTAGSNGALDEADYARTVATLLGGGSDPVITMEPDGAWTHTITDAALK